MLFLAAFLISIPLYSLIYFDLIVSLFMDQHCGIPYSLKIKFWWGIKFGGLVQVVYILSPPDLCNSRSALNFNKVLGGIWKLPHASNSHTAVVHCTAA